MDITSHSSRVRNQGARESDRKKITDLGRGSYSALRVQEYMPKRPIANIGAMSKGLKLSVPTVTAAFGHLAESWPANSNERSLAKAKAV